MHPPTLNPGLKQHSCAACFPGRTAGSHGAPGDPRGCSCRAGTKSNEHKFSHSFFFPLQIKDFYFLHFNHILPVHPFPSTILRRMFAMDLSWVCPLRTWQRRRRPLAADGVHLCVTVDVWRREEPHLLRARPGRAATCTGTTGCHHRRQ